MLCPLGQTLYISWLDGIKGDLNQALILLSLVLLVFLVFVYRCLGFCVVVIYVLLLPAK